MPVRKVEAAGPGATAPADRALLRHSGRPSPGGSFVPRWTSPGFILTATCCRRFTRSIRGALCPMRTSFGSPGWRAHCRNDPPPSRAGSAAVDGLSCPAGTRCHRRPPGQPGSGRFRDDPVPARPGCASCRSGQQFQGKGRRRVRHDLYPPRIRARRPNVPALRCTARLPPIWLTGCGPFFKQNGHRIAVPVGVPWLVRDERIRAFRSVPARR